MKLQVITSKLTNKKIFELFKIRIPLHIIFVNKETNEINHDYTIQIVDRLHKDNINYPSIKRGEHIIADTYDRILTIIDMRVTEGYSYQFLADSKDILFKKPLLELLGSISIDTIESCIYLDYNHEMKYFEIRNPDLNKNPEVIYFFPSDKSILQFSDTGPELFLSPSINNITDLICE